MGEAESLMRARRGDGGEVLEISRFGWLSLAGGLVAAVLANLVPFLAYLSSFFAVLVHEMGHALAGWFFGYHSIPSFDFFYGGGVTIHQDRFIVIVAAVCVATAVFALIFRRSIVMLAVAAAAVFLYTALAFSSAHQVLIMALGHGTELIIVAIFLYRAMSGRSILQKGERPVNAFMVFFLVIYNVVWVPPAAKACPCPAR